MFLAHADAAFNLARWLTLSDSDAQDVVQEAFLRALRFIDTFHGTEGRPWILAIVRNTCFTWMQKNRTAQPGALDDMDVAAVADQPEELLMRAEDRQRVTAALERLPPEFREALVLRELEEMSYKEVAQVAGISIGTVMSRLSRGRARLKQLLAQETVREM